MKAWKSAASANSGPQLLMPAATVAMGLTCQHQALALLPCMAVQTVNGDAPGTPQEALMGALQHRAPTGEGMANLAELMLSTAGAA